MLCCCPGSVHMLEHTNFTKYPHVLFPKNYHCIKLNDRCLKSLWTGWHKDLCIYIEQHQVFMNQENISIILDKNTAPSYPRSHNSALRLCGAKEDSNQYCLYICFDHPLKWPLRLVFAHKLLMYSLMMTL